MKKAIGALLTLALVLGAAALVVLPLRRSARIRAENLALVRQSPAVSPIVEALPLKPQPYPWQGEERYEYLLDMERMEMGSLRVREPYLVLELGVDEQTRPYVLGITLYSGANTSSPLTEADLQAVRTICFWIASRPERKSYQSNGRYQGEGTRQQAYASLYDVESGQFFLINYPVAADALPETAGSLPDLRLEEKHFRTLMRAFSEKK